MRCIDCELDFAHRGDTALGGSLFALLTVGLIALALFFGRTLDAAGYLIARGGDTIYAQGAVYFSLILCAITASLGIAAVIRKYKRHVFLGERPDRR